MVIEIGKEYKGAEIGQLLEELSKDELHKACIVGVTFFLEKEDCQTNGRIISELRKTDNGFAVDMISATPSLCDWGTCNVFWTSKENVTENMTISAIKISLVCLNHENKNIKRQNSPIEIGKEYRGVELKTLLTEIFEKALSRKFIFDVASFINGIEVTTNKRNMVSIEKTETGFYVLMVPNQPNSDDCGAVDMIWFEKDDHKEDGTITMLKIIAMTA